MKLQRPSAGTLFQPIQKAENIETKTGHDLLEYLPKAEQPIKNRIAFQRVDPKIIENEINKLKPSKAAGHDKIPVKLVRDTASILSKPFATIFNSSLEKDVFPNLWKVKKSACISYAAQHS